MPEPTNENDKNAIKVELGGVHIAYVPSELCKDVSALLKQGYIPKVSVRGGPYKFVESGKVWEHDARFRVYVDLKKE